VPHEITMLKGNTRFFDHEKKKSWCRTFCRVQQNLLSRLINRTIDRYLAGAIKAGSTAHTQATRTFVVLVQLAGRGEIPTERCFDDPAIPVA